MQSNPSPVRATLLSGLLGGLVVLIAGAVLLATGAIGGETTTREVVRDAGGDSQPVEASEIAAGDARTVNEIYREEGRGVVSIEAEGVDAESPFGAPDRSGDASGSGFVVDENGTIVTREGDDLVPTIRWRGANRYDTARLIATDDTLDGTRFSSGGTVFVARGDTFPDALAANYSAVTGRVVTMPEFEANPPTDAPIMPTGEPVIAGTDRT